MKSFRQECESKVISFTEFLENQPIIDEILDDKLFGRKIKFKIEEKNHLNLLEKLMDRLGITITKDQSDFKTKRKKIKQIFFSIT